MSLFTFALAKQLIHAELRLSGHKIDEGGSSPEELQYLYETAKQPGVKHVAEIGFNVGLSSYAFLKARKDIKVVSFDIGAHPFVVTTKKIIDRKFPGRHTIVYGDSTKVVPEYAAQNPDTKFDLIFIDGGHEYEVAKADIGNMKLLAHPDTLIIIDDLSPWLPWGVGPARAWGEAIQRGEIVQTELYNDGKPVKVLQPPGKRSWALGRYL